MIESKKYVLSALRPTGVDDRIFPYVIRKFETDCLLQENSSFLLIEDGSKIRW